MRLRENSEYNLLIISVLYFITTDCNKTLLFYFLNTRCKIKDFLLCFVFIVFFFSAFFD
jgi:hypothetical protein